MALRGNVAIAGVGLQVHKRATAPHSEYRLALEVILEAAADAGMDPREIDGFVSFGDERNDPCQLSASLGVREMRFANKEWGGGGGGASAALGTAAAAIMAGLAECVVVYRALCQGQFIRYGAFPQAHQVSGWGLFGAGHVPYGIYSETIRYAIRATRTIEELGVDPTAMRAVVMAAYHHAARNPQATMRDKALSMDKYDESRMITEPYRLYDCCLESDGAAAMVLVSAERAKALKNPPAYILGVAQGAPFRQAAGAGESAPIMDTAGFSTAAPRLFKESGLTPQDVDVVECYENYTMGVVMALIEHGFCTNATAGEVLRLENLIAPSGKLPLNTSGGHMAEGYVHGMNHHVEAVRQLRGTSTNQVPGAKIALAISGPWTRLPSSMLLGAGEVL